MRGASCAYCVGASLRFTSPPQPRPAARRSSVSEVASFTYWGWRRLPRGCAAEAGVMWQRDSSCTRALRRASGSISLMAGRAQTAAPAERAACRSGGSTPRLRHLPYLIRPGVFFAHRGARGGRGSWSGGARDLAPKPQHPCGPNTRVNLRNAPLHSCSPRRSGTPACRSGAPCKRPQRNGAPSRPERPHERESPRFPLSAVFSSFSSPAHRHTHKASRP